jgi:hypothetical protein
VTIISFPDTLSFSTAEDSQKSSNCNDPTETSEGHLDNTELYTRKTVQYQPCGRANTFKQSELFHMTPQGLDTHTLEDGREE